MWAKVLIICTLFVNSLIAGEQFIDCSDIRNRDDRLCDANSKWNKPDQSSCKEMLRGTTCDQVPKGVPIYEMCCEKKQYTKPDMPAADCSALGRRDDRICDANSKWNKPDQYSCIEILAGASCNQIPIGLPAHKKCCLGKQNSSQLNTLAECSFNSDETRITCPNGKSYKLESSTFDSLTREIGKKWEFPNSIEKSTSAPSGIQD